MLVPCYTCGGGGKVLQYEQRINADGSVDMLPYEGNCPTCGGRGTLGQDD
jgi:DnaJ-class molecular chaperone